MHTFLFKKSFSFRAMVAFLGISMLAVVAFVSAPKAEADQDPGGCTAAGVNISLGVFRADGVTPIGVGTVAAGETIKYITTLSHAGAPNCNYESGTINITTPNGVVTDATPVGGVLLVSAGTPRSSQAVSYVVNYAHSGGDGILDATTTYTGGTSHTPIVHSPAGGNTGISVIMESHVIIRKNAVPDSSQVFTFQNNFGGNHPASFNLTDDATPGLPQYDAVVLPGKYAVSETPIPAGWQLDSATCDQGETVNDIDVAPGETVICTFTNEQLAKIILVKNTIGGNGTFTFDVTNLSPDPTEITTVGNTGNHHFNDLNPDGDYAISENVPAGWALNSAVCDNGDPVNDISPNAGEVITCTFTNEFVVVPLVVEKTATTTYERAYQWRINKTVVPSTWNMFMGDSGTSEYTVEVVKSQPIDSNFVVSGTISITNPVGNPTSTIIGVVDNLEFGGVADVDCPGVFPQFLAPGATLICTYSKSINAATNQINTVEVTTDGGVPGGSDTANVVFGAPNQVINDKINVNDSIEGPLGEFSQSGSTTYEHTFVCGGQGGYTGTGNTVNNTATIVETGVNDSAQVTVNCYTLQVTKDATESLDRKYNWDITKVGDQTSLDLAPGQVYPVNYDVTVSMTGSVDSNWHVEGNIHVHNPSPVNAVINSVSDIVSNNGAANVSCEPAFPYTLLAGETLHCTYDKSLPDGDNELNTATAVQQNYDYDKNGAPTPDGTTNYSGNANVNFGEAVVNEVDECINVSDTFPEFALAYPGLNAQVCINNAPKTFEYVHNVGPYTDQACGTQQRVDNTASFVTNDTQVSDSDDHTVLIDIVCTCTLTQGYWKTHNASFKGGAPVDPNWELVGPLKEQTLFFNSGKTWFEVFWTSPQGNAWYNLAHQYMAAKLNILSGASAPANVLTAISSAEALFQNPLYDTPAEFAALGKKSPVRADAISWAGTLGSYNEGLIGPGHCSEAPIQ